MISLEAVRQAWGHSDIVISVPHTVPNAYRLAALGLSKTIADEVAEYGVTVNTIATGSIATNDFMSSFRDIAGRNGENFNEILVKKAADIPMKRFGKLSEIGASYAFLCSDPAGYITGATLRVDGGKVKIPI